MLSKITVNGFKSLENFTLSFGHGLNVLIGPNGAGKSNICQSLALLGAAADNKLIEYVLSLGGARNIFKAGVESPSATDYRAFDISCIGYVSTGEKKSNDSNLLYEYGLKVSIGEELRINTEELKITRIIDNKSKKVVFNIKKNEKGMLSVRSFNDEFSGPKNHIIDEPDSKNSQKRKPFKLDMADDPTESFLDILSQLYFFVHVVGDDLKRLKVLNVDPHIAKNSSDILEPLTMLSDGRRLANAIYELDKRNDPGLLALNSFMANIMPRYKEINSELSSDGLTRSFSITDTDGNKFPAQSLSDGTVKTIAFMVGMLECDKGSIIIEEPENYLHPWACNSLVEYIRKTFAGRSCIITTHSETMLNAIKPSEIIVCTNLEGYTNAQHLRHSKALEKAIKQSGFGCGYHYISGSLGGVPI